MRGFPRVHLSSFSILVASVVVLAVAKSSDNGAATCEAATPSAACSRGDHRDPTYDRIVLEEEVEDDAAASLFQRRATMAAELEEEDRFGSANEP